MIDSQPIKVTAKSKIATSGLIFEEPVIFELGSPGRKAYSLPTCDVPELDIETLLPIEEIREPVKDLPELSELDVVRHYTRLSQWNFSPHKLWSTIIKSEFSCLCSSIFLLRFLNRSSPALVTSSIR